MKLISVDSSAHVSVARGGLSKMSSKMFEQSFGIAAMLAIACLITMVSPTSLYADSDLWTKAQTVEPADLAKELGNSKTAPTVVFVGFRRLYSAGHIKGAQYHGTAGSEEGLKELTTWAAGLPRSTNLVIYCGCCPLERCPNIRPAFKALERLGFTNLRVLLLPQDFGTDWAGKGFPYDKGE
jgi:thiosulfate/3-mercaptopyruvate sulfurtransferase